MYSTNPDSIINLFSQKVSLEHNHIILNDDQSSNILESICFSIDQYPLTVASFELSDKVVFEADESPIYGEVINEDQLILKDVEDATDPEILKQAEKQGLIGLKTKKGDEETIKLARELPANIKSVTYYSKDGPQTIDPAAVEILTPEEKKRVISKIKAQIIYLRTLHPKEEEKEEAIQRLTILLRIIENKVAQDQDDQNRDITRHLFIIIKSYSDLLNTAIISSFVAKILADHREQAEQDEIEKKKRFINKLIIDYEINKEEIKREKNKLEYIIFDVFRKCMQISNVTAEMASRK